MLCEAWNPGGVKTSGRAQRVLWVLVWGGLNLIDSFRAVLGLQKN